MTGISGGGLSVTPLGPDTGTLNPFVADASKVIAADVPEPTSFALFAVGAVGLMWHVRRRGSVAQLNVLPCLLRIRRC